MPPPDDISVADLARQLGRDAREVEKDAGRGKIPARRVGGEWRFNPVEIRQWLEQEMRNLPQEQLARLEETQPRTEVTSETPVCDLLKLETVEVPLDAGTKRSVLQELIGAAARTWNVFEPAAVLKAVQQREEVMSTAFENGIAIPHPRNPMPDILGESIIAYGRTLSGIPFGAPRRQLSDIFFLVLARDSATHLRTLARLGRMLQLPDFVDQLRASPDSAETYDLICEADRSIAAQG